MIEIYAVRMIQSDFCGEKLPISLSPCPRQNMGYTYVCFFDLNHFCYDIKPRRVRMSRTNPNVSGIYPCGIRQCYINSKARCTPSFKIGYISCSHILLCPDRHPNTCFIGSAARIAEFLCIWLKDRLFH